MLNFISTSLSSPFPSHLKKMGTGVWFSAATVQLLGFQFQRHWPSYTFSVACDGRATLTAGSLVQRQNLTGLWRWRLSSGINIKRRIRWRWVVEFKVFLLVSDRREMWWERLKNQTVEPVSALHPRALRVRTARDSDGRAEWTESDTCAREVSEPPEHPALAPVQLNIILTCALSIDNHTCDHFGLISLGGIT